MSIVELNINNESLNLANAENEPEFYQEEEEADYALTYVPNFEPFYDIVEGEQIKRWVNQFRHMYSQGKTPEYIKKWVDGLHHQYGPAMTGYAECDKVSTLFLWNPEEIPLNIDYTIHCDECERCEVGMLYD